MSFKRYGFKAAGVLIIRDSQILAVDRVDGRGLGLPFGKPEKLSDSDSMECAEQTARRECLEETGIVVGNLVKLYEHNANITFLAMEYEGDPVSGREGVVAFVDPIKMFSDDNAFAEYSRAVWLRYLTFKVAE